VNGKQRIVTALQRKQPDAVPSFEWFIDAAVGRALTGKDDPLEVVEQLDLDGINVRADYRHRRLDEKTLIDEWDTKRQLTGDCIPAVLESPIRDVRRQADYEFPDPAATHRFATLARAVDQFGDRRAVVLNLRDGFSDVRDLLGYEGALMALLLEPQQVGHLLARSVTYNLELARIAKQRFGTNIVATTDDVANAAGLLMRPETYFAVVAPHFQAAIQGYRDLGYYCIKHCDGNVDAVLDFWLDCGIHCLDPIDPGGGYQMATMKAKLGQRICLKGNIDCTGALCSGTELEVQREVQQCLRDGAPGGGLILSSSNTIHRGVRPENYRAMLHALRKYGRYPCRDS
jgi:uroporphyrinogen decarboxylase